MSAVRRWPATFALATWRTGCNGNPDNEPVWENWLQDNRVELNAMTSPERVAWVERKFAAYTTSRKLFRPRRSPGLNWSATSTPPSQIQVKEEALRSKQRWIEEQIAARIAKVEIPTDITARITNYLERHRSERWKDAIRGTLFGMMVAFSIRLDRIDESLLYEARAAGERGPAIGYWREIGNKPLAARKQARRLRLGEV